MTVIGMSGKAGSGKDTVAAYLVEAYGFKKYAFADAVRDAALQVNPIIYQTHNYNGSISEVRLHTLIEEHGWDVAKREIPEVRRLLQVIGTEVGRNILGPDVWVDIVETKMYQDGYPDAVITDCRFHNEIQFLQTTGGNVWLVERENNPVGIQSTHASETFDVKPYADWVIDNSGSLSDLYAKIDGYLDANQITRA